MMIGIQSCVVDRGNQRMSSCSARLNGSSPLAVHKNIDNGGLQVSARESESTWLRSEVANKVLRRRLEAYAVP